jgi:hypothetical protein
MCFLTIFICMSYMTYQPRFKLLTHMREILLNTIVDSLFSNRFSPLTKVYPSESFTTHINHILRQIFFLVKKKKINLLLKCNIYMI